MNFFHVIILDVGIVICLYLINYKHSDIKWKKHINCCKNNFYFFSIKRCLLQHIVGEPFEKKDKSGVLLKDKNTEGGRKKERQKTMSIKSINKKKKKNNNNNNNNNNVLKNLNNEEINKQRNMTNERIRNKNKNDKGVENISSNTQMEEKSIICKDINWNVILNENEINDDQMVQEIKEDFVKDLMKNKNKEIFKQIETINSVGTMAKIKNSLYSIIFKGSNFWKGLGIYLGTLSGAAIGQMILTCILKFGTFSVMNFSIYFSAFSTLIAFGSCVGLILLTIIIVIFLLVWLWPSRGKLMGKDKTENKSDT
ncbi:putative exported protein [Plasmodium reichenowi]|uniref:Putative exported protein n=1 Tax=Plasmodium reichenowi TaxID=5854 RepID=A0A151L271_PLARE|nr:putative exported protein [Plasmodium reichenowi]KYN93051.1 putative exported protein [Plasmodium reichenowi]